MLKYYTQDVAQCTTEMLVMPVCEGRSSYRRQPLKKLEERALALPEFQGRPDDMVIFHDPEIVAAARVMVLGMGLAGKPEALRSCVGRAVKRAHALGLHEVTIALPDGDAGLDERVMITAFLEGALLANHVFDTYKSEHKIHALDHIRIALGEDQGVACQDLLVRIAVECSATVLAREWVSMPANDKYPRDLGKDIILRAGEAGSKTAILDHEVLGELGFGALIAVGQGSVHPPELVVLDHDPGNARRTVVLVGKGITFDAGGINLKSHDGLEGMKADMAGAAAVAGTIIAAASLCPDVRVVGVLPLAENMPSGSAVRPGDVVRTFGGKTVEIMNTDAEGRLVLADSLAYACETYSPDVLIDVATLTGACVVALGEKIAGVFTPDDALAAALVRCGEECGERCWRMPLPEDYRELLKSEVADMANVGPDRWGGAITAALFLKEFAGQGRWAHLDIAGPALVKKEGDYVGVGGTGFGVRLLCRLLEKISADEV